MLVDLQGGKEIDFMAMNGINMPLTPIGSEAVWYETLQEFNFTKKEALSYFDSRPLLGLAANDKYRQLYSSEK